MHGGRVDGGEHRDGGQRYKLFPYVGISLHRAPRRRSLRSRRLPPPIGGKRGPVLLPCAASAAQIGTAFLRCPEAKIAPAWADAIGRAAPEDTMITRAFSGRPGRGLATAPRAAPYPVQRGLTQVMRDAAVKNNDIERMQAWFGLHPVPKTPS
jgi:Nitronate monooxygenase